MAEENQEKVTPEKPDQSQSEDQKKDGGPETPQKTAKPSEKIKKLKEDLDKILDEVDEVLEENAEEFVKGFVQRGGE